MCCSPHRFAVQAATHYHTRAWQTLIYGKECFIFLLIKGYKAQNSVTNLWKKTGKNPNLDLVHINAYTKFGEILSICSEDIERKQNSDINQGPKLCYKSAKKNPNQHLVNISAYTKFGKILSICSQDIAQKQNYDGQNDERTE